MRTETVATAAAGAVLAAVLVLVTGAGVAELVFAVALLVPLSLALRHVVAAGRQAHREGRSARVLLRTDPARTAQEAVVAERARLALDVQSAVRADVDAMRALARTAAQRWDEDPAPALAQIQETGRHAMTDLRRLLGLLRDPAPSAPAVAGSPAGSRAGVRRVDVVLAAIAVADALVSSIVYPLLTAEVPLTAGRVVLTCLVALTVLARTVAPGAGAVVAAGLVVAGTLVGHPPTGGLWVIVTIGGLAWACGATERRPVWAVAGPVALVAALVHKHQAHEPENLFVTLLILGVGLVVGVLARFGRVRGERARRAALARRAELDGIAQEALSAERRTVARELHDAVSGSVGVIVMQAGAAQALLAVDRPRARHALDVVVDTCENALAELTSLLTELAGPGLGLGTARRGWSDIESLAERMRSAGLAVDLDVGAADGAGVPALAAAYRVIQEALTNVLRHAPGAHVRVRVRRDGGWLVVDVEDDGPGPSAGERRGYGLVGLAERVQQVGGTLVTGPSSDPAAGPGRGRGFEVHARLPLDREPAS